MAEVLNFLLNGTGDWNIECFIVLLLTYYQLRKNSTITVLSLQADNNVHGHGLFNLLCIT